MQIGRATAQAVGISDDQMKMFHADALKVRDWKSLFPKSKTIKFISLLPPVLSVDSNKTALANTAKMMGDGDELIIGIYLEDKTSTHFNVVKEFGDSIKESEDFCEVYWKPQRNLEQQLLVQTFARNTKAFKRLLEEAGLEVIQKGIAKDGKRVAAMFRTRKALMAIPTTKKAPVI